MRGGLGYLAMLAVYAAFILGAVYTLTSAVDYELDRHSPNYYLEVAE